MAVETKLAAGLPDKTAAKPGRADVRQNHGALRTSCFVAAIASGDSATSTYEVARLPSHARVSKLSKLHCTAITGAIGATLGPIEDPDAIMTSQTLATAGTFDAAKGIAVADVAKPLWELAGLTKDPKTEMPIFLTIGGDATAAGSVAVDLVYITE